MIKQKLRLIINIVMSLIYIGSGLYLLLGKNIFNFSELARIGFGNVLLLYGLLRLYGFIRNDLGLYKSEN